MNVATIKINSIRWKKFLLFLVFAVSIFQNSSWAQDTTNLHSGADSIAKLKTDSLQIDTLRIELDSTLIFLYKDDELKKDTIGFLKKIMQPFKFKANRDNRKKKVVYDFMLEQIKEGNLKMDQASLEQIMIQFDTIHSVTKINKTNIDSIYKTFDVEKKATKKDIDALKTKMTAVAKGNANATSKEKQDLKNDVASQLSAIKAVQYSCASNNAPLDSMDVKDSVRYYFKSCLTPKIKVIGWYYWRLKDEYKRYNYNYLSAINLYGYELAIDGKNKRPEFIEACEDNTNGVIKKAQKDGCAVHLTVYNKSTSEITGFLNRPESQDTLLARLQTLIVKNRLKGINLFFENIKETDAAKFVSFVSDLRRSLKPKNVELYVTIPSIKNNRSYEQIKAYNFDELNPLVDYYLVRTGEMADKNTGFAQSQSPLYTSDKFGNYTVESTINYYNNGKIPSSKLILTVSYLGLKWKVKDFSGDLAPGKPFEIGYKNIVDSYFNKKVKGRTVDEGFDPIQVASYLNIINKDGKTEQIWYEDFYSLYQKYQWAIDNKLGGVSIRGMGYDDGPSDLWDALGVSLMDMDTCWLDTISLRKPEKVKKIRWPIIVNAWNAPHKWKTFKQDLKWSTVVRLKFDSIYVDTLIHNKNEYVSELTYYRFNEIVRKVNLNSIVSTRIKSPIIWEETMSFEPDSTRHDEGYLKNLSYCYSLYSRWKAYSLLFASISVLFLVFFGISFWILTYRKRYLIGTATVQKLLRIVTRLLFNVALLFFIGFVYFQPFLSIGAGLDKGVSTLEIFIAAIVLTILGRVYNLLIRSRKKGH